MKDLIKIRLFPYTEKETVCPISRKKYIEKNVILIINLRKVTYFLDKNGAINFFSKINK